VVALAGGLDADCGDYRAAGIASVMSIIPRPMSLDEAISAAPALIRDTARRVVELWSIPGKIKTSG
jgi:glycerate kinase